MKKIEQCFNPKRYELFVGVKSDNNLHLYQKLGYAIFQKAPYGCGDIEMFFMEKSNRDNRQGAVIKERGKSSHAKAMSYEP
jgi:hypothetical protein